MVFVSYPIRPYEKIWEAICKYESNNDPYAIGDKHLRHKSYGIAQIRKSRLDDYYQRTGIRYTIKDMFDPVKSKEVFMYYASCSDLEVIARRWNGGERGMDKKTTLKYWNQIKKHL
ncbi:MAG: transglycosylase SLT domain-containing protein, partial [Porphyromonadaceae bacterium]|nr:transglycosylase SLT domain-containing protein [Porphyromonadaceae bacterium]